MGLPPVGMSDKYAPLASILAVIYLGSDGSVLSVELPRDSRRDYVEGIRKIFPIDVQEKIFNNLINYGELSDHANRDSYTVNRAKSFYRIFTTGIG